MKSVAFSKGTSNALAAQAMRKVKEADNEAMRAIVHHWGGGGGGSGVPEPLCYLLPPREEAGVCSQHAGYVAESSQLRDDLLLRCHVAPFAKTISEREWLRGATRMWDLVRKSANVADYNRTLQKLHFYQ